MRRPTLAHRCEAALTGALGLGLRALPERPAQALGSALGWLAGSVLRIRRRVVDENLRLAFPDADPVWRRRIAALSYRHVAREAVALVRLADLTPRRLWERTTVEGLDLVRAPLAEGRGVIVLTGHVGNWEIGGASVVVREVPLAVVAKRQSNPLFDRRLRRTRERLGMKVIDRQGSPKEILRALREPRAVALVADQNVRHGGVFVDFFGVPASTARGPATLARRAGAVVLLATAERLPGLRARYHIHFRPLRAPATGNSEADDRGLLGAYMAGLEEAVRKAPAQYFWLHRRWKTRPGTPGGQEPDPGAPVQHS